MDFLSRRRGRKLGALAVAAGLAVAVLVAAVVVLRQPVPVTARALRIAVTDGPGGSQHVSLDATFFTPPGGGRVPAILLAHGFGETKDAVRPEAEQLARLASRCSPGRPGGSAGPPGRSPSTHPAMRFRTSSSWSAGWPGSPG